VELVWGLVKTAEAKSVKMEPTPPVVLMQGFKDDD
jgi:hypothetical protein